MVTIVERKRGKTTAAEKENALAAVVVEERYQDYDVVWCRLDGFPWWPCMLFFSYNALERAQIGLNENQSQLVLPPPRAELSPDGKASHVIHRALCMFLDKFDVSIVEVTPKFVCAFDLNYEALAKVKQKDKHRSGFKLALKHANRVYHSDGRMSVAALAELAKTQAFVVPPHLPDLMVVEDRRTAPKKQKRSKTPTIKRIHDEYGEEEEGREVLELSDDDEEDDSESDYTDGESGGNKDAKKKKKKMQYKTQMKATQRHTGNVLDLSAGSKAVRSQRAKAPVKRVEAIDEDDSDFEIMHSHPPRPRAGSKQSSVAGANNKKASRKEGRVHQDPDVISLDDSESEPEFAVLQAQGKHPKQGPKAGAKSKASKAVKNVKTDEEFPEPKKSKKQNADGVIKQPKKPKSKPIDSDSDFEEKASARKSSKKKAAAKNRALPLKQDLPELNHGEVKTKDEASKGETEAISQTPLSSIWTTREKVKSEVEPARLAYKLDLLWDDEIFTDHDTSDNEKSLAEAEATNARGGTKRQGRSVQQSQIRQSLLMGNLDPHTMVQCETYRPKGASAVPLTDRPRGAVQLEAPYDVVVHPDAVFICDLHSHLATCEIIGFLGGRWDEDTKTLHIQAAFPCRSLVIDGDDGSTDVEMDPGSEIELREIIQNAQLEVVGWYHSHPAFAPDPSIRDIENQTSYQQLFQRQKQVTGVNSTWEVHEPFVGLIVGTFDSRRESPVGLFRYFHCRGEKVSYTREVFMPYELVPRKRRYRSVVDEERKLPKPLKATAAKSTIEQLKNGDGNVHTSVSGDLTVGLKVDKVDGSRKKRKGSDASAVSQNGTTINLTEDQKTQPPKKKPRRRPGRKPASAKAKAVVGVIELASDPMQEVITIESSGKSEHPEVVDLQLDDLADAPSAVVVEPTTQLPADADGPVIDDLSSQPHSETTETRNVSEDIVCDSGHSQDNVSDIEVARGEGDDYVPASSSSSQGEALSGYDASQSILGSQSQGDEADASAACSDEQHDIELDPYAGIDVLPDMDFSPVKAPKNTAPLSPAVNDDEGSVVSDEVIGDSAPDSSAVDVSLPPPAIGAVTNKAATEEAEGNVGTLHAAQAAEESISPDATPSIESAAVDATASRPVSAGGRRRTRKPTLTVRHMDSRKPNGSLPSASPAPSNSSPHARGFFFAPDDSTSYTTNDAVESQVKAADPAESTNVNDWGDVVVLSDSEMQLVDPSAQVGTAVKGTPDVQGEEDSKKAAKSVADTKDGVMSDATVPDSSDENVPREEVLKSSSEPDVLAPLAVLKTPLKDNRANVLRMVANCMGLKPELLTKAGYTEILAPLMDAAASVAPVMESKPDPANLQQQESSDSVEESRMGEQALDVMCDGVAVEHAATTDTMPKQELETVSTESSREVQPTIVEASSVEVPSAVSSLVLQMVLRVESHLQNGDNLTARLPDDSTDQATLASSPLEQRRTAHLESLRTKYGRGVYGCTEQIITLIDYYRDFERRTNLFDLWKPKITRCDKLDASLRANVRQLNLPVALRDAFVDDVMGYLRSSWEFSKI